MIHDRIRKILQYYWTPAERVSWVHEISNDVLLMRNKHLFPVSDRQVQSYRFPESYRHGFHLWNPGCISFHRWCFTAPFVKIDTGFDVSFQAGLLGFDCRPFAGVYCLNNPDTGVPITEYVESRGNFWSEADCTFQSWKFVHLHTKKLFFNFFYKTKQFFLIKKIFIYLFWDPAELAKKYIN